nr:PREDICTED: zinc finger CCCH domain-containing protein ZFN-like isoform X3 [Musa acuminata subsp. malaccensis]
MWKTNMRGRDPVESGPYPDRPGEPDCAYYIRTGLCRFGMTCKFNHPQNRMLAIAAARIRGGYPERVGQPECQYYLKTGTCKFGSTCKFHHPKEKAGIAKQAQLNILGYPLRPQSYPAGMTNWTLPRSSYISSPRWQASSSYAQLILPQGVVQVPGWTSYSGQLGSSPGSQQTAGVAQFYSPSQQGETNIGAQGKFSSYRPGSVSMGLYAVPRENIFPERPGQPECQFYMKTGDCKFGAVCRFHHPRERLIPTPNCVLNPLGLPLRPGEPLCVFYSRYGICKFGPNCKFDHPMGPVTYGLSESSMADVPTVQHLLGSSLDPPTLTLPSEETANGSSGVSIRAPTSDSRRATSVDENDEADS